MSDTKQRLFPHKWLWVITAVVLCALFAFAMIPGAAAQGRLEALSGALTQTQSQRYISSIQSVFDFILRNYIDEVDPRVLFEGAMNGMLNALGDPNTAFLSESDMRGMTDTTQGRFGGVGLNIIKPPAPRPDGRPSWVEVVSPIEGTPGWRAGINPGDFIAEINGEPTEDMSMEEVLNRLRGTPGEDVQLLIRRGEIMEIPLTVTRAIIEVPTVRYAMIGDIGFLRVLTFTPMTPNRVRDAINMFAANNYTGLVLDLRDNFGGLLNAAVQVSELFLDGGLVVRTTSRIPSENRNFYANRRNKLVPADIPVVVLINRASASGSEIVAGALKDRGRAFLVGENTFGKGSVQQVIPLERAGFRITTARYLTPSDADIDRIGIPPDREIRRFPEITDEDAINLNELNNANRIPEFIRENPEATRAQIEAFAGILERKYNLSAQLLQFMIRNEQTRRTGGPPVYDLEHDVQLQEAVNILQSGIFPALMENFRTLREIQDEAETAAELPIAS